MKEEKIKTISSVAAKSFSVNLDEVQLPSGRRTERIRVLHPDASAVLPILDDERIMFVKQFRYSIQEETIEIPAGKIDPGENPEECMRREFEEETGFSVGNLELMIRYVPAIGYSSEILYIFKGTNIHPLNQKHRVSTDEISEVITLTEEEAKDYLKKGVINDGKTIIALYMHFYPMI